LARRISDSTWEAYCSCRLAGEPRRNLRQMAQARRKNIFMTIPEVNDPNRSSLPGNPGNRTLVWFF
jgi:hypothetical protein